MPIKVTYQNPGLEYDENMVCEDFLNMGMLPLECMYVYIYNYNYIIYYIYIYILWYYCIILWSHSPSISPFIFHPRRSERRRCPAGYLGLSHPHAQSQGAAAAAPEGSSARLGDVVGAEVGVKPLVKTMVISSEFCESGVDLVVNPEVENWGNHWYNRIHVRYIYANIKGVYVDGLHAHHI